MSFKLPELQFEYADLEPHIDAQTMEIHYTKHHQGYVNKLNAALEDHDDLQKFSVEELLQQLSMLPESVRTAVQNNGGGHANHSLFWSILSPAAPDTPTGKLLVAIEDGFEDFDRFKGEFSAAALSRFGSGWAWLVVNAQGGLTVMSTPNQDSPLSMGMIPILGLDVWEHAYYLNYQNRRGDYIEAWWSVVDWEKVGELYEQAVS